MGEELITIGHADYALTCDPVHGGVLRCLTWRDQHVLRAAHGPAHDPLGSACFPLVPFSNRISGPLPSASGTIELAQEMPGEPFPIHGLGWRRPWTVTRHDAAECALEFSYDGEFWPSSLRAVQTMTLGEDGLRLAISIANTGDEPMPAGLGLHPYFPRGDARFGPNVSAIWEKDERGLPERENRDHPFASGPLDMALALMDHSFGGWDGTAEIVWPSRRLKATLSASATLRELVIYSPEEDYFCVEPVSHLTNAALASDPEKRAGWCVLEPGENLSGWMHLKAAPLDERHSAN